MKLGLFSVSYAGLWGQTGLDVFAFLDKASRLGFEGVMLMAKRPHLSPLDANEKVLKALQDKLARTNLKLIGLAAYNDFLVPASAEIPVREMQIAYIEECARITSFLGGKSVRIFTGYERVDAPFFSQWELVVSTIQECADRAEKYGVTVVVQNHHDLAVDSKALSLMVTEIDRPNVKVGYDAWSPFLRGENLYENAKAFGSQAAMSIVADYIRIPRYQYEPNYVNYSRIEPDFVRATTLGEGEVDYQSFFKGLKDGGFDGWVIYEMCSPLIGGPSIENLDKHATDFICYMKKSSF